MRTLAYALAGNLLAIALATGGAFAHDSEPTTTSPTTQVNAMAKTYFDQAEGYSKKKDWNLAIAAYQQAVRIDPKFVAAWSNMGYCYRKVNQFDKAMDAYKRALTLKPDYTYPHEYLGRTYLAMGNKDAAMREYEILKRLDAKMAAGLLKAIEANNADLGDED